MGDTCTATWDEIIGLFNAVSSLNQFKATNYLAQGYYISFGVPDQPPEPVIEIDAGIPLPDDIKNCDELIYLAERGAG